MPRETDYEGTPRSSFPPVHTEETPIFTPERAALLRETVKIVQHVSDGRARGLTNEQFVWLDHLLEQVRFLLSSVSSSPSSPYSQALRPLPLLTAPSLQRRSISSYSSNISFTSKPVRFLFVVSSFAFVEPLLRAGYLSHYPPSSTEFRQWAQERDSKTGDSQLLLWLHEVLFPKNKDSRRLCDPTYASSFLSFLPSR
jgi:hypothetical protein